LLGVQEVTAQTLTQSPVFIEELKDSRNWETPAY